MALGARSEKGSHAGVKELKDVTLRVSFLLLKTYNTEDASQHKNITHQVYVQKLSLSLA